MSSLKPGARVKRFKASDLSILSCDGLAAELQDVNGLKKVAEILSSSGLGLVQVDKEKRTFGMHQLFQQAVGKELGWQLQCKRMQTLLHTRCGKFGDGNFVDTRMFGVMREILQPAVAVVDRVRFEGAGLGEAWSSSGMLLRLHELAIEVYGVGSPISDQIRDAAHGSVVSDIVFEHAIKMDDDMTLNKIAAVPYIQHTIQKSVHVDFDVRKCLSTFLCATAHSSLVASGTTQN